MGEVIDFNAYRNVHSMDIWTNPSQPPTLKADRFKNVLKNMKVWAVTPSALEALQNKHGELSLPYIRNTFYRFDSGDFGKSCDDDVRQNKTSLQEGLMVMGVYPLDPRDPKGDDVWMIMDAGHETVTLLLPEDY